MIDKIAFGLLLASFASTTPSQDGFLPERSYSVLATPKRLSNTGCKESRRYALITTTKQGLAQTSRVAATLKKLIEDEPKGSFCPHPDQDFFKIVTISSTLFNYGRGKSALHSAAHENDIQTAQTIIDNVIFFENGNYLEDYINLPDSHNKTALWYAIQKNHLDFADMLFSHYASLYPHQISDTILHSAMHNRNKKAINLICKQEQKELECLYQLIGTNEEKLIKIVVDSFAQKPALSLIAFPNKQGETPIDLCPLEMISALESHAHFLKSLLQKITPINTLSNQINKTNQALKSYFLLDASI